MRPGPKPTLRDLEAAALAKQHVGGGHTHIVVDDLGVADRRIVISEHAHVAHDPDARRFLWYQHHRLLQMLVGISGSVFPITIRSLQSSLIAPDVNHLRPLMT